MVSCPDYGLAIFNGCPFLTGDGTHSRCIINKSPRYKGKEYQRSCNTSTSIQSPFRPSTTKSTGARFVLREYKEIKCQELAIGAGYQPATIPQPL